MISLSSLILRNCLNKSRIIKLFPKFCSTEVSLEQNLTESVLTESALTESALDSFGRAYGTGRRKTSVARVWIKDGSGQFIINGKKSIDYFQPLSREQCVLPLVATKMVGLLDVWCTVKGGGTSGQAGAIRLGISRALDIWDKSLRPALRQAGMLTRDSRRVERKKAGQKKARKKYQWVKR